MSQEEVYARGACVRVHKVCVCIGAQNAKVKASHLTKAFIYFLLARAQDPVTAQRATEGSGGKKKEKNKSKEKRNTCQRKTNKNQEARERD